MLTKLKTKLTILILVILALTSSTSNIKAATLFEDNFDSEDSSQWMVIGDSGWNIQNGQYGIHLDPGLSDTIPIDSSWNYNWQNIAFETDLRGVSGTDKNILVKFVDSSNFIEIHHTGGTIYLQKTSTTGGSGIISSAIYPLDNGPTYHFRIEINQHHIKLFINNNFILEGDEPTPYFQNWKIGLREGTGAVHPTEVWYDNVSVTDLPVSTPTPTPSPTPLPTTLPSLNVPDIKQFTNPWGSQTYDQANIWSPNDKTIKSWGCALTSADMILQYYGFAINPGQLNTWLTSQPDGFIPNGQLNWLAISRYSKQNSNSSLPSLEYKRFNPTNQNLINELKANRPAILQEPGHFVVAKSQTSNSFGINDPAYSNHPTLASYGNTFETLGTYTPSHTDLSYIMLTINPSFNIKVFDANNNEITGQTFIDEALVNDTNNSATSGNAIKIFEFPKPPSGNYKVEISGNGTYELDSLLYDINGNVKLTKTNGIIGNNQIDQFNVVIGQNNSTSQNITIQKIIEDWENARSQNKITRNSTYEEIKVGLKVASDLINHHNNKLARITLFAVNALLKLYTPKYIDTQTSQILQSEIQLLANSL